MQTIEPLQIGVMFWAGRDPHETLRELKQMGVTAGQLGVAGDYSLKGAAEQWKRAIEDEKFAIKTVFAAYTGESYTDVPTVQNTVGFIPKATREEREKRTYEISDFARDLGVKSIACHIGFVPHSASDPEYVAARELVRRIADYAQKNGQTFALETGQEPAQILANFMRDVARPNLTINFDPANMVMYGSGDPIAAFSALSPQVESIHCKDGEWPEKEGSLGVEKRLGDGAVGMEQFINKVKQLGYKGILAIEREVEDRDQRKRDIQHGIELLQRLRTQ